MFFVFRLVEDIKWKPSVRHLKFDEDNGYNEMLYIGSWDLLRCWAANER